MSVYTIGDLHLSFGVKKPMDIFRGWDNYVERLTENWNRVVSDGDTVVVPGDISWAMDLSETAKDFEYIDRVLNGEKILLKGNHDYWWTTAAKMNRFLEENGFRRIRILNNNAFLADGISIVGTRGWINDDGEPCDLKVLNREAGRLRASAEEGKKLGGELTAFLHYPPIFNGERNEYVLSVIREYGIRRCFYGHIHGAAHRLAFQGEADGTEFRMVSADYLGFMPIRVT